ncbi:uncharacterized protein LOC103889271 isoform X2 [Pongo abelii]|uniref:uncharacterized protein LOC103889271 isoform X2 n=1 Tax=Pongo abelii TaxID=9601 RepID=UPI003007B9A3
MDIYGLPQYEKPIAEGNQLLHFHLIPFNALGTRHWRSWRTAGRGQAWGPWTHCGPTPQLWGTKTYQAWQPLSHTGSLRMGKGRTSEDSHQLALPWVEQCSDSLRRQCQEVGEEGTLHLHMPVGLFTSQRQWGV